MHTECCIAAGKWDRQRGQPVVSVAMMMEIQLYSEGSRGRGADEEMAVRGAYLLFRHTPVGLPEIYPG